MSTYLQLCQDLVEETNIPVTNGLAPSTVVGQSGQLKDIVKWVQSAWVEIQNSRSNWRWMRRTATVSATIGVDTFAPSAWTDTTDSAPISRFSHWWANNLSDPPKIYLTSTGVGGERYLSWSPWDWFKTVYRIGTQTQATPAHITIDPNNNIVIGPAPNDTYTMTCDYQMAAQVMTLDADVPDMPTQYHRLIVYRGLRKYANREAAPELLIAAAVEGRPYKYSLERNQMTPFKFGDPLA